jgi:hypothetical protein
MQPLDDGEDVLLVDEGHLDVHLGELGLAVEAEVLVAEALVIWKYRSKPATM